MESHLELLHSKLLIHPTKKLSKHNQAGKPQQSINKPMYRCRDCSTNEHSYKVCPKKKIGDVKVKQKFQLKNINIDNLDIEDLKSLIKESQNYLCLGLT